MLIQVEKLNFEYAGVHALINVSFGIEPGMICALVGPNGAGKTTLLRCLAALEKPIGGTIQIDGIDVLEEPRLSHRRVGYLSDFFGLYDRLTVRQCLSFVARSQGIASQDCPGAIAVAARRLQIEEHLNSTPARLSRGLRQRVAIAQAIIHEPKVLLLDEPASGLDPEARHALTGLFLELQRKGMTLLVSSHILAELEDYSTSMLILRKGRIVEQIAVGRQDRKTRLLRILLAEPVADLLQVLTEFEEASEIKVRDREVLLRLHGDDNTCHRLLKFLVEKEIPVCEFSGASTNLQDAYLATVTE
ncbi:MAG: ABC transporter ATP-binding protein [Gammaproteobacteria bacterium]